MTPGRKTISNVGLADRHRGLNVRFGFKADIAEGLTDACFTPESGHGSAQLEGSTVGRLRGGNV